VIKGGRQIHQKLCLLAHKSQRTSSLWTRRSSCERPWWWIWHKCIHGTIGSRLVGLGVGKKLRSLRRIDDAWNSLHNGKFHPPSPFRQTRHSPTSRQARAIWNRPTTTTIKGMSSSLSTWHFLLVWSLDNVCLGRPQDRRQSSMNGRRHYASAVPYLWRICPSPLLPIWCSQRTKEHNDQVNGLSYCLQRITSWMRESRYGSTVCPSFLCSHWTWYRVWRRSL